MVCSKLHDAISSSVRYNSQAQARCTQHAMQSIVLLLMGKIANWGKKLPWHGTLALLGNRPSRKMHRDRQDSNLRGQSPIY